MIPEFAKRRKILVDWGVVFHKAVFVYWREKYIKNNDMASRPERSMLYSLLSSLRHIGVREIDDVIIAVDSKKNWRKLVEPEYKANRKEARERTGLNWNDLFDRNNKLLTNIDDSTPFYIVKVATLEADDIIAAAVKKYPDHDVIAVTVDSDFDQLFAYKNFKFFSSKTKRYKKPVKNPYGIVEKKIKREVADNLVSPIKNKDDYNKRKMIVNLITLPDFVEKKANEALDKLGKKSYNIDGLYYSDEKVRRQYDKIWNEGVDCWKSIKSKKKKNISTVQPLF